ncbi:tetratricopeptide repeat protein [Nitrosomonas sp.]|uniref:tetratricopeptide repeat protein n=1 Tax=Nitrosomonas sp. TaxID=42353 RepID=UPI0025EA6412|nr:tetratricopeptide repeat protein [Nitrosomonas sp.]
MKILTIFIVMVFFFLSSSAGAARNKIYCGELKGPWYGPYDYLERFNLKDNLDIVEIAHFTPDVENLISGNTSTTPAGDLSYTLNAWPNHHRALATLVKYSIREKSTRIQGLKYPVECYFDRAIRMNAKDAQVRSIYSAFLSHHNRNKEALEQLQVAVNLEPDNATFLYNLGLLYFKQKNYEKASHYAGQAYALGYPLPGLRNKLIQAGKWKGGAAKNSGE